ncbi:MAG: hypothetical protein DMF95_33800 [Acidobacteria bacterium]|nr:MAG: hypothetical protein DMF96_11305 [Acidobacteriota bacterium]PYR40339.1 MAG: hypothetical protein DMF95_33800 [Acidobacteriota bacterium]
MAGDRRILREDALRRPVVQPVVPLAVHVMIPARGLQEGDDLPGALNVSARSRAGAALGQHMESVRLLMTSAAADSVDLRNIKLLAL